MVNTNAVRNRITNKALNRSKSFTTAVIAKAAKASLRHTRRVIAELVNEGALTKLTSTTYQSN